MARARGVWRCQQCGCAQPRWVGRCPECGEYGSYVEEAAETHRSPQPPSSSSRPVSIREAEANEGARRESRLAELDRVLGGGLVEGSFVLVGGEPGVGKSTLMLQAADAWSEAGPVLYVSAEESVRQVAMRAARLGSCGDVRLLSETEISRVEAAASELRPAALVVDSIQTVSDSDLESAPGSVSQVRACAARLMRLAKETGIPAVTVGHVTKEGAIAGPRVLEHMVDAVLYFEGDAHGAFRVLRCVKNRFGAAGELGMFEMTAEGLRGVGQPSGLLLAGRAEGISGSAVLASVEGLRSLLVEIQALVTPSHLQVPRRLSNGIDTGRLLQVLAVLERRAGLSFGGRDVHVSVAGGVRIVEPAADLPLALALASALTDTPLPEATLSFGEVGLGGELRPVPRAEERLKEAVAMGFRTAIGPAERNERTDDSFSLRFRTVKDLASAIDAAGLSDARHGAVAQSCRDAC